jgi:hypothetical protein
MLLFTTRRRLTARHTKETNQRIPQTTHPRNEQKKQTIKTKKSHQTLTNKKQLKLKLKSI